MPDLSRHDFSSLSVKDLVEARDAYHVHLAHLGTVFATAIGKYLIRDDDPNAKDPAHKTDREDLGPRRLDNSSSRPWSWPCVLVFVDRWFRWEEIRQTPALAQELVPSFLYLPDGRVVPTCVVQVDPDRAASAGRDPMLFQSDLVGGGFPIETTVQGQTHVGSIGCLVSDGDAVYALTNRHVAGPPGREIFAGFKNTERRLGVSDSRQLGKRPFSEVYPGWPGDRVLANLDAGLVRIDDIQGWTAQVYGIGEIGAAWDLDVHSFRLDIIGCPLVAFGGASGEMKGRILGLFYRYKTVGGAEYVTDLLIGPRDPESTLNHYPGDSGTLWFEDDPTARTNARGARILRPVALEWGGQALLAASGKTPTLLALGICLSTICRELDVELIADWNIGHTEYWGVWGHVKIGAYATSLVDAALPHLQQTMRANADNIGLDDALLKNLKPHEPGAFSPLADVADLVWRFTRHDDESNHFADMDKRGPDGKTLLEMCAQSPANISPDVWNAYYAGINEDRRGALPFRVWQIFDLMADYARARDVLRFTCAAGLVAHYVGDACQPLHISQFHHGHDLGDKPHAMVHSLYETTMIKAHGPELIEMIPTAQIPPVAAINPAGTPTGHDAAQAVIELMQRTVKRLPPLTIVNFFDAHMGHGQADAMWDELKDRTAACMQDGARTLARIWEAAWRAGGGETNPASGAFPQDALRNLYSDSSFLPSYKLQDITLDGSNRIVPKSGGAGAAPPTPAGRRARRPAAFHV